MEQVRLDRWLFAVRLFKSRSQAAAAVTSGKVKINGETAKAHRPLRVGDEVFFKRDGHSHTYKVLALLDKRVGAKDAVKCYEHTVDAELTPEVREMVHLYKQMDRDSARRGRPTKRDRREIMKMKQDF